MGKFSWKSNDGNTHTTLIKNIYNRSKLITIKELVMKIMKTFTTKVSSKATTEDTVCAPKQNGISTKPKAQRYYTDETNVNAFGSATVSVAAAHSTSVADGNSLLLEMCADSTSAADATSLLVEMCVDPTSAADGTSLGNVLVREKSCCVLRDVSLAGSLSDILRLRGGADDKGKCGNIVCLL